ncbi:uncharacterized protein TM35_000172440 [Trypanosoma theileri]|uniref:Uncharacterized protein n=1 Tax=Trypanosoma theileri TaxID=67003 RepID=A0A1X0NUL8_9TRYP|nr:uncharacterized protein TM35_000172440 [Trypanosoma theileri]ORC88372.1 hypothetical protein TM35_000172440 [Trypanosoma theileri]
MKTADHLRSLISDLENYEKELKEKVQQKEAELDLLLRKVLSEKSTKVSFCNTSSNAENPCEFATASSAFQLRISRNPIKREVKDNMVRSPSPCLTGEKRRLNPSTVSTTISSKPVESVKDCNSNNYFQDPQDDSGLININEVSSISRASNDISMDSGCPTEAEVLLTTGLTEKSRPTTRRVRFVSRSPQIASSDLNKDKEIHMKPEKILKGKPRSTPMPNSKTFRNSSLQSLQNDDKANECCASPVGIVSKSQRIINKENNNTLPNNINDHEDKPCYIRQDQKQRGPKGPSEDSRCIKDKTDNISSDVLLPRLSSLRESDTTRPIQRRVDGIPSQQQQQRQQQKRNRSSDLIVKTPRISASRSVSAARTQIASSVQQEGRGAGIVLACGPTLFFD